MHKCVKVAAVAGGLLLATGAGAAQVDVKPGLFNRLDSNRDGVISRQEMNGVKQALAQNGFDRVDTDHDGRISQSEYVAKAKRDATAAFNRMDADDDRDLSLVEATRLTASDVQTAAGDRADSPMAAQVMRNMDVDGDGRVSASEWSTAMQRGGASRSATTSLQNNPHG